MLMKEKDFKKDEWLWKINDMCPGCYFVYSGTYNFIDKPKKLSQLEFTYKGNLLGDFPSLTDNVYSTSSCQCTEDGSVYYISKEDLGEYLIRNPGIFVTLNGEYVIT